MFQKYFLNHRCKPFFANYKNVVLLIALLEEVSQGQEVITYTQKFAIPFEALTNPL